MMKPLLLAMTIASSVLVSACVSPSRDHVATRSAYPSNYPSNERKIERLSPEALAKIQPAFQPMVAKLSLEEIVAMKKSGATNEAIIQRIRETQSNYRLAGRDIIYLHNAGVSSVVIDLMLDAERQTVLDAANAEMDRRDEQRNEQHREELQRLEQQCRSQMLACQSGPYVGAYIGPYIGPVFPPYPYPYPYPVRPYRRR